jgi:hypothetical protein
MIRPSEIRVWSLICPSRASRGSVRAVSTASVHADLFAETSAPAVERATPNAISVAAVAPCATRDVSDTPLTMCSSDCSAIGSTWSGMSPSPSSHLTQPATVGHVCCEAFEPTTKPKCPARMGYS